MKAEHETLYAGLKAEREALYAELKAERKAKPWPRGTLAVIGSTALLVVRKGNRDMGTAPHDCPAARVATDGEAGDAMERVFDALYDVYGNGVDTKSGPDQRRIFREGLEPMLVDYPKLDILLSCHVMI